MNKWISVNDRLPSTDKQVEVVFYANPYAWETGLFTPRGFFDSTSQYDDVFERYEHHGDCDFYERVENVTHWMPLPAPSAQDQAQE